MKEIEIKFRCSKEALTSLMGLTMLPPDYIFEKPYPYETHDSYLDTQNLLLLKQGAALRCRKKGDRLRVTFKSNPSAKGARITREEQEREVPEAEYQALLNSGVAPGFCAPAVFNIVGDEDLKVVLQVLNHRKVMEVKRKARGVVAEMSLDDVLFIRNDKQVCFFGIEVELKDIGNEADLVSISKGLLDRFPELVPDAETKFEKGMRLLN